MEEHLGQEETITFSGGSVDVVKPLRIAAEGDTEHQGVFYTSTGPESNKCVGGKYPAGGEILSFAQALFRWGDRGTALRHPEDEECLQGAADDDGRDQLLTGKHVRPAREMAGIDDKKLVD